MARIQTPQTVQELQAEFKVREPFGLELLETIQPTYQLGRQKIASTGYPRDAFGVASAGAGGVGTNVECSIQCPANRGIVILVTSISFENLAGRVTLRMDDGTPATPSVVVSTTKAWQDGRLAGGIPDAILEIFNPLTAAPNGQFVGQYSGLADDTITIPLNVVLGGGSYILARDSTANSGNTVNFQWTEFLLEDR